VERGVFDSGLSVQEIPDINRLSAFANLTEGAGLRPDKIAAKVLSKAWGGLQGGTQWRENVLRYAAYREYVHRLEAGEDQLSIGYGGSLPKMVDAVKDPRDRAALLARDLLGDYSNVSHAGQEIRRKLIPFWSWLEINTKRYWRLSSNAFAQGTMKGVATGGLLGAGRREGDGMAWRPDGPAHGIAGALEPPALARRGEEARQGAGAAASHHRRQERRRQHPDASPAGRVVRCA
jgi:hypothetical protein